MILILSFSNLSRDQRVKRQIKFLKDHAPITAVGFGEGEDYISITKKPKTLFGKCFSALRLLTGQYERHYWMSPEVVEAWEKCSQLKPSLVIANDIETLPLALKFGSPVIFDAHEYAPREFEDLLWKVFYKGYKTYLCKKYIPQVTKMMTVSEGLAREYAKRFGVMPEIITNAPNFTKLHPQYSQDNKIRMVSHGYAMPNRKIEEMIAVMEYLDDRFTLDLYLLSHSEKYLAFLKERAKKAGNVQIKPAVPMDWVVTTLNNYDIGMYLLQPNSFNNLHSLPNKLFEFIQGRLALAIGPSPEMKAIVERFQCGVVSNDFRPESLAQKLSELTMETIMQMKENVNEAAKELCAEENRETFLKLIKLHPTTEDDQPPGEKVVG